MAALGGLLPSGYETLEDNNGVTVPGGLIWTYAAGTTTPIATYTDPNLSVANPNPIIADAAGRWTAYAAFGQGLKLVFETPATPPAHGATIKTCDNIVSPLTELSVGDFGGCTVINDNSATGTVNNYVLVGRTKDTFWMWNGSADLTLTGIAGGANGHRLTIKNNAPAPRRITFPYLSSSSTNPFYTLITGGPGMFILAGGWAEFIYNNGQWVISKWNQGAWLTRTYSASNYSAATGTWTVASGGVGRDAVWLDGKTLHFAFDASGPVSAATSSVSILIPGGFFYSSTSDSFPVMLTIGASTEMGIATWGGAATTQIIRLNGAFPIGNVRAFGQIVLDVQ